MKTQNFLPNYDAAPELCSNGNIGKSVSGIMNVMQEVR